MNGVESGELVWNGGTDVCKCSSFCLDSDTDKSNYTILTWHDSMTGHDMTWHIKRHICNLIFNMSLILI